MAEYYVRATGGNDTNDGLSFANGWATLAYADTRVFNGDTLYICSDSLNKFTNVINLNFYNNISFYGADLVDGSPYNGSGKAYIVGGFEYIFTDSNFTDFRFYNIEFDGNLQSRSFSTGDLKGDLYFENCNFINFTHNALKLFSGKPVVFKNCDISNNNSVGEYYAIIVSDDNIKVAFIDCKIHDNDKVGLFIQTNGAANRNQVELVGCRIYKNGNHGIQATKTQLNLNFNLIYGNAGDGIRFYDDCILTNVYNTIVINNGAYGINYSFGTVVYKYFIFDYNCFYNNTSGNVSSLFNGGVLPGANNILSDPQFKSVADGAEDWSLNLGSPAGDVALGYAGGTV